MVSSCELDDLPRFFREDQFVDDTVLPPPIGIFRRRLVMVMSRQNYRVLMFGDFEIARTILTPI